MLEYERDKIYWQKIFQDVSNGKIETWDYQWIYTVWINKGLSIMPNKNLVSNIGFGHEATHTTIEDSKLSKIPSQDLSFPLIHHLFVYENKDADKYTASNIFYSLNFAMRIFSKVKRIFG